MSSHDSSGRILVHYSGRSELTGGPRSVLLFLEAMHGSGMRPVLLTEEHGPLATAAERLCQRVIVLPLRHRGTRVSSGNSGLSISLSDAIKTVPRAAMYTARVVREVSRLGGVDAIWTRGAKGVLLMAPAAYLLRKRLIWDVDLEFPSRGLYRLLNTLCVGMADLVVAQSEIQAKALFGFLPNRLVRHVTSLLPPVPPERAREISTTPRSTAPRAADEENIVIIGSVSPRKNQLEAVRALELLVRDHPSANMTIIGPTRDARYEDRLIAEVHKRDLTSHVSFLGWRDDVPNQLAQADALLMTSLAEGVPHVVREAMLMGVPVVAGHVGGVPELIRHRETGWLVDPQSAHDIASKLEECLYGAVSLRERVAENVDAFVRRGLSASAWTENYVALVQELIENG